MAWNHSLICDAQACTSAPSGGRLCQPFGFESPGESFGDAIGSMEETGWTFAPDGSATCPGCDMREQASALIAAMGDDAP